MKKHDEALVDRLDALLAIMLPWPIRDAVLMSLMMIVLLVVVWRMPLWLAVTLEIALWLVTLGIVAGFFVAIWWIGATYGPFIRIGG